MAYSSPERTFNTKLLKQHVELHSDRREFLDPISLTIVVPIQARFVIPCEQRLVGIFPVSYTHLLFGSAAMGEPICSCPDLRRDEFGPRAPCSYTCSLRRPPQSVLKGTADGAPRCFFAIASISGLSLIHIYGNTHKRPLQR